MEKFYEWMKTEHNMSGGALPFKTQALIGYMMQFLHEKYNCKEIDFLTKENESIYVTAYDFLKREIEKRTK